MIHRKDKNAIKLSTATDPLFDLEKPSRELLVRFGIAHTKYVWNTPVDRVRWLLDSRFVDDQRRLTKLGRNTVREYAFIHDREIRALHSLCDSERELLARRLRRNSINLLSESAIASRLCETRWLNHLEAKGLAVNGPGITPRYPRSEKLTDLIEYLSNIEMINRLTVPLREPSLDNLQRHGEFGHVTENYEGVTDKGQVVMDEYCIFLRDAKRRVLDRAKHNSALRSYFKTFSVASRLAGVETLLSTEEMVERITTSQYTNYLDRIGHRSSQLRSRMCGTYTQGLREEYLCTIADEFYSIAGQLSATAAERVEKRRYLTAIPYAIAEEIDPTGHHYYSHQSKQGPVLPISETGQGKRNSTSSNVLQISQYL